MGNIFESTMADKDKDKQYTSINRDKAAGHVEHKGGKAVWEWADHANDSTSILLKSLENPELELEKTQNTPMPRKIDPKTAAKAKAGDKPEAKKRTTPKDSDNPWGLPKNRGGGGGGGGGFDPYNRS